MNRSKAREQAFLILFQRAFDDDAVLSALLKRSVENNYITEEMFTKELCEVAFANIKEIDELLVVNSERWQLGRLSKVAVSVLRLAIAEIKYMDNVPFKVSINEAIELAKKFSGEEESSFVNGVLAGIVKDVKKS
ncbi:MAG: transcription antitermination factor NusB [Oscillospiraceae bacterium]|jgi:N utilization substance protein B|nr:transcription antitermination factor NusB [Oscillospiraceae bacterium]